MRNKLNEILALFFYLLLHIHFVITAPTVTATSSLRECLAMVALQQEQFTILLRGRRRRHTELNAVHVIGKDKITAMSMMMAHG